MSLKGVILKQKKEKDTRNEWQFNEILIFMFQIKMAISVNFTLNFW